MMAPLGVVVTPRFADCDTTSDVIPVKGVASVHGPETFHIFFEVGMLYTAVYSR